jgi:hypothetical protein
MRANKSNVLLATLLSIITACSLDQNKDHSDKAFLSGGKSEKSKSEDQVSSSKTEEKTEPLNRAGVMITVQAADWDRLSVAEKKCEAQRRQEAERMTAEIAGALAKGKTECLESLDGLVNEKAKSELKDTISRADEFKKELMKYRLGFAVVNGDCVGVMTDGHKRMIRVKQDACLSVPFVRVGTGDGEIQGIDDAVSSDAMSEGILSLSCDAGKAHIKMTTQSCPSPSGAASKMTFEKL